MKYYDAEVPERVPGENDIDTLVNIIIGSPAVCLYRALDDLDSKYLKNINTRVEYQNLMRENERGLRWKK